MDCSATPCSRSTALAMSRRRTFLINSMDGGRRNYYCYVVQTQEAFVSEDPNWIRVQGYRALDSAETRFSDKTNDISVELDDVIGGLHVPHLCRGWGLMYKFLDTVKSSVKVQKV